MSRCFTCEHHKNNPMSPLDLEYCSHCLDGENYTPIEPTSDPVNNPSHYTDGNIEVIDYICDKFDCKSFCLGNAIKYISRAGKKSNEVEDLQKAIWYINHYLEVLGNERV